MKNKERNEICKLKYEGKVFQTKFNGDVVVLQYENSKNVKVKFLDTGNIVTTCVSHLNAGLIKDKQRPTVCLWCWYLRHTVFKRWGEYKGIWSLG